MAGIVETLKHVLGLCGDHWHPNIFTLASASPILAYIIYYLKNLIEKL